nr:Na/Pi cotransporter family protein [Bacillota bacterium]
FPILGVLTGAATTAVIQSSSATIGILQQIYSTGGIPLIGAIAIVLGDNIGTTVTSVMASIGGSASARRTAMIHVMFNSIGTVIFFILIRPYTALITWFGGVIGIENITTNKFMISLSHIGFNLINVFVLYFFIKQLVWLVTKIIPGKGEVVIDDIILDETLLKESPDLALENARNAISNMGNVARGMFEFTYNYAFVRDEKEHEMADQCEELLDSMDDKIHNYLVSIGGQDLVDRQIQLVAKDMDTVTDIERIGDHLDNLIEFFEIRHDKKMPFHEKAREELEDLFSILRDTLEQSLQAYVNMDKELALQVNQREDVLDKLVKKYRKNHVNRLNDKTCDENEAGFYVDILSNLERIGDHCNNMVINVLTDDFTHDDKYY